MNKSVTAKTISFSFLLLILIVPFYSCQKENAPNADPPEAKFTYTSVVSVPLPATVQFVNTSTTPAGGTSTFKWHFGDGTTATTQDPSHIYTQHGTYQVMLGQTPSTGTPDTVIRTLTLVTGPGPSGSSNRLHGTQEANFVYIIPSMVCIATFKNTSANGSSYLWKFGDGSTSTTDSSTVTHTYLTSGTYHVNLTANNSSGTDTTGATISF